MWHTCPGSYRQHYSDALSEQGSMAQVQVHRLEGSGDYSVVSELEDHIVSGSRLGTGPCQCGLPLLILG